MLCKRFVFTDDMMHCLSDIKEYARVNNIKSKIHVHESGFELETQEDDEKLYEICSFVSECVSERIVSKDISSFVNYNYDCFNSDECKIICRNALDRDIIDELPGRIYVFVKVNKEVNLWGFYRFMCKDMQDKCICVIEEEADKIIAVNDNSNFIELLKNFSGVSMEYTDSVELSCDISGIRIISSNPSVKDAEFSTDDTDVLAELVSLNPRKIKVLGREEFLKNDLSAVITAVFNDRIEYR